MSPLTAHDLRRARCAAATRTAKAQARSGPSSARAAAASAARSAAEPARWRASTACPTKSTAAKAQQLRAERTKAQTVADPCSGDPPATRQALSACRLLARFMAGSRRCPRPVPRLPPEPGPETATPAVPAPGAAL